MPTKRLEQHSHGLPLPGLRQSPAGQPCCSSTDQNTSRMFWEVVPDALLLSIGFGATVFWAWAAIRGGVRFLRNSQWLLNGIVTKKKSCTSVLPCGERLHCVTLTFYILSFLLSFVFLFAVLLNCSNPGPQILPFVSWFFSPSHQPQGRGEHIACSSSCWLWGAGAKPWQSVLHPIRGNAGLG